MKMGYTLTRRPYLLLGFFHMLFGLLLLATGVIWLFMTFFYWPKGNADLQVAFPTVTDFYGNHTWTRLSAEYQAACWIVYTVWIWTGFWVSISYLLPCIGLPSEFIEQSFLKSIRIALISWIWVHHQVSRS